MLDGMFTSDPSKRAEVARKLRNCGFLGNDVYLLSLPDGLEKIWVKHGIDWMARELAVEAKAEKCLRSP